METWRPNGNLHLGLQHQSCNPFSCAGASAGGASVGAAYKLMPVDVRILLQLVLGTALVRLNGHSKVLADKALANDRGRLLGWWSLVRIASI